MKTFETEKGNIPDGATHHGIYGCDTDVYFKEDNGVFLQWHHENWSLSKFAHHKWVKPIPQTNVETPEEKELLDSIDVKLVKPREPSKPVITKVEWGGAGLPTVGSLCKVNRDSFTYRVMYSSEYVVIVQNLDNDNTTAHGMDIILDLREGDYTFSKPETPQQREERERLEAAYDLFSIFKKSCGVMEFVDFDKWKDTQPIDSWLAVVDKTNYRKDSE